MLKYKFDRRLYIDSFVATSVGCTMLIGYKGYKPGLNAKRVRLKDPREVAVIALQRQNGNLRNAIRHLGDISARLRRLLAAAREYYGMERPLPDYDNEKMLIDGAIQILKKERDSMGISSWGPRTD